MLSKLDNWGCFGCLWTRKHCICAPYPHPPPPPLSFNARFGPNNFRLCPDRNKNVTIISLHASIDAYIHAYKLIYMSCYVFNNIVNELTPTWIWTHLYHTVRPSHTEHVNNKCYLKVHCLSMNVNLSYAHIPCLLILRNR